MCTKFLQYRIDARNLIHLLKNTIKYNTPDLRDVVVARVIMVEVTAPKATEATPTEVEKKSEEKVEKEAVHRYNIWK